MPKLDHTKNIIEVRDVSFSYGSVDVLKNINLNIHQGDYFGFAGPNGSGKTTLIKIMLGLLRPSTGGVKIFGQDIKEFKDWSKIGYVPQKVTSFDSNFPATVEEIVLMGRYSKRGLFKSVNSEDKEFTKKALEQVGMWEFKDRLIGDLSGGQQQRVFIARALAARPEIIFLDEPTTGVDQPTQEEFFKLLKKLNEEDGLTLVLVSHDIDTLTRQVMHVAYINQTITCFSCPKDFLEASRSGSIFG